MIQYSPAGSPLPPVSTAIVARVLTMNRPCCIRGGTLSRPTDFFDATAVDEPLQLLEVFEALYDMDACKAFQSLQACENREEVSRLSTAPSETQLSNYNDQNSQRLSPDATYGSSVVRINQVIFI